MDFFSCRVLTYLCVGLIHSVNIKHELYREQRKLKEFNYLCLKRIKNEIMRNKTTKESIIRIKGNWGKKLSPEPFYGEIEGGGKGRKSIMKN